MVEVVSLPEIPLLESMTQPARRLGQRDILPTRVTQRLLSDTATVAHTLSGSAHTGTISDAQHGARGVIVNAHSHSDLSGVGANDHHNKIHSLSGLDHTGSLSSSQIPAAHRRRFSMFIKASADAAAADTTVEIPLFQAQDAVIITAVFFLPDSALTASDTNYATLTASRRNSTGGGKVTIASVTTQTSGSGNWTAFDGVNLGNLSNASIATGEIVSFEIGKTGTGVVVPRGVLQIEMTVD